MNESTRARDEWLALRCLGGDEGAFDDLIAAMERPLFYYAIKLANSEDRALDVLQEVWLRALHDIGKLKEPGSVRSWLYTLTRRAAVDQIRREESRERTEALLLETFEEASEPVFTVDDAAAVHHALDSLDRRHREVLVLYFLEDFSLLEISQILNCPQGTVKSRIHYAKRALRTAISEE